MHRLVSSTLSTLHLTGYARVILTLASFCVPEEPTIFFPLYVASFLMDALDGHLARKYDQCTRIANARRVRSEMSQ